MLTKIAESRQAPTTLELVTRSSQGRSRSTWYVAQSSDSATAKATQLARALLATRPQGVDPGVSQIAARYDSAEPATIKAAMLRIRCSPQASFSRSRVVSTRPTSRKAFRIDQFGPHLAVVRLAMMIAPR